MSYSVCVLMLCKATNSWICQILTLRILILLSCKYSYILGNCKNRNFETSIIFKFPPISDNNFLTSKSGYDFAVTHPECATLIAYNKD